jgi:hypothetical protein
LLSRRSRFVRSPEKGRAVAVAASRTKREYKRRPKRTATCRPVPTVRCPDALSREAIRVSLGVVWTANASSPLRGALASRWRAPPKGARAAPRRLDGFPSCFVPGKAARGTAVGCHGRPHDEAGGSAPLEIFNFKLFKRGGNDGEAGCLSDNSMTPISASAGIAALLQRKSAEGLASKSSVGASAAPLSIVAAYANFAALGRACGRDFDGALRHLAVRRHSRPARLEDSVHV